MAPPAPVPAHNPPPDAPDAADAPAPHPHPHLSCEAQAGQARATPEGEGEGEAEDLRCECESEMESEADCELVSVACAEGGEIDVLVRIGDMCEQQRCLYSHAYVHALLEDPEAAAATGTRGGLATRRTKAVQWIAVVSNAHRVHQETLECAVIIFDRYLSHVLNDNEDKEDWLENLALIYHAAAASLLISSKLHETRAVCFAGVRGVDNACLMNEEMCILKALNFDICPTLTPSCFVRHLLYLWPKHREFLGVQQVTEEIFSQFLQSHFFPRFAPSTLSIAALVVGFAECRVDCQDWLQHVPEYVTQAHLHADEPFGDFAECLRHVAELWAQLTGQPVNVFGLCPEITDADQSQTALDMPSLALNASRCTSPTSVAGLVETELSGICYAFQPFAVRKPIGDEPPQAQIESDCAEMKRRLEFDATAAKRLRVEGLSTAIIHVPVATQVTENEADSLAHALDHSHI